MKIFARLTAALVLFGTFSGNVFASTPWPTSTAGVEIGSSVRAVYANIEPSGLAWHSGRNQLLMVGDEGQLVAFDTDGSNVTLWNVGGDLEDLAVADPTSPYVYLDDENGRILKYNLTSSTVVQSWDTTAYVPEIGGNGMEGFTYANGYFYGGYQYNGKIYVFDLSGSSVVKVGELAGLSSSGYTNLSGLYYRDGYLYALYDNTMAVMSLNGTVEMTYSVPGFDQEGIAMGEDSNGDGDANMYIAQDNGGTPGYIYSYDNFPIFGWSAPFTDSDADADGVAASVDCNDNDASVSTVQTYYVDNDGDGLGSSSTDQFCVSSAPAGYANNSSDTNDSITNAGIEINRDGVDNDGDGQVDEYNTLSSNGAHPYYSSLDPYYNSQGKLISYYGLKNGQIVVNFGDNARYRYQIFNVTTSEVPSMTSILGTAFYQVTLAGQTVMVNGYTGEIVTDYTPRSTVEIGDDSIDNDGDGLVDEHNTVLSNGYHPIYGSMDPNSSTRGKITGFWGLKNGEVGIRYADGSRYRYRPFARTSSTVTTITQISGTAYFTVTLEGQTATINGYNGLNR